MIRTSRQLKALVRNLSKGDNTKAQIIIRNYVMERFPNTEATLSLKARY